MVTIAERGLVVDGLAATAISTAPLPLPVVGVRNVIQLAVVPAPQAQFNAVVIRMTDTPPVPETPEMLSG